MPSKDIPVKDKDKIKNVLEEGIPSPPAPAVPELPALDIPIKDNSADIEAIRSLLGRATKSRDDMAFMSDMGNVATNWIENVGGAKAPNTAPNLLKSKQSGVDELTQSLENEKTAQVKELLKNLDLKTRKEITGATIQAGKEKTDIVEAGRDARAAKSNEVKKEIAAGSQGIALKRVDNAISNADKPSALVAGAAADVKAIFGLLDSIEAKKKNVNTGIFASVGRGVQKLDPTGLLKSKEYYAFDELEKETLNNLSNYMNAISGKAVSEQEAKRLMKIAPTVGMDDVEFNNGLKSFREQLGRSMVDHLTAEELRGQDVSGLWQMVPAEFMPNSRAVKATSNTTTIPSAEPKDPLSAKTITSKQYSEKLKKTKITYSDGTVEVKDGKQ